MTTSGIAATLLPRGQTAHSRFKIPLNPYSSSVCSMSKLSDLVKLITQASTIVWDEAPMVNIYALEVVDRTLRYIIGCDAPFGGKVVILGGDFRQVLPVIPKGNNAEMIAACIVKSPLWAYTNVLHLRQNMHSLQDQSFVEYLMRIELEMNGYQEVGENANEAKRTSYRESKKKDCKTLFLIDQCVNGANFERIASAKTTKEACDSLEEIDERATKMKKVKLQIARRMYELLQMEENETMTYFFTKIHTLISEMKSCGEEVKGQSIIKKVLMTLTPKYYHIVFVIEESNNLEDYKIEELQSSLEAHEQRLKERGLEKNDDHALQA
ncbi:PREDICTED: uncharacterized protein LOC109339238 [Lupinus angustifolius]|uniref:uncharacterized protein LOC109339238 n=1 Tax=Lupinus angustifolius TaxID=3871 RepID=UPI00092F710F|nr:PREDICTED: uncharacterized protein LOC109339238 [Lupinus angustifolius]